MAIANTVAISAEFDGDSLGEIVNYSINDYDEVAFSSEHFLSNGIFLSDGRSTSGKFVDMDFVIINHDPARTAKLEISILEGFYGKMLTPGQLEDMLRTIYIKPNSILTQGWTTAYITSGPLSFSVTGDDGDPIEISAWIGIGPPYTV